MRRHGLFLWPILVIVTVKVKIIRRR